MAAVPPSLPSLRTILFWAHLAAGVAAGSIILLMSVTGVLLTYEKQLVAWADRRALGAPVVAGEARLPVPALIESARNVARTGAAPTAVVLSGDATAPVQVSFGRAEVVFVDPYTGTALGSGATTTRAALGAITAWHRWLGATGEGRDTARAVTGAANLAFLFLVLSGLVLWFPRRLTWTQLRAVLLIRRGLRGKARDFNWHHALGIWSFVPLVFIVSSGVVISYRWAGDLVYRAAGESPPLAAPRPAAPRAGGGDAGTARPNPVALEHLDPLLERAARKVADWRTITMTLPPDATAPVSFSIDRGNGGQPQRRATLALDPADGTELSWLPFEAQTPGRRARSFLRFAHTGEYFGLAGQTLAGLVTLATAVLVWTGIALAWRRLTRALALRAGVASPPPAP